jgi:hypothetical protein
VRLHQDGLPLRERVLGHPDRLGTLGTLWGAQGITALPRGNACVRLVKAWNLSPRVDERAIVTSE